ncbi:MAG: PAS domain-containing sensor histidine kinase [Ardenticatenaceae bacterium]|nr:PAS domain-containing sensor histidine kinase [Ardenticatenaceae bacterium]MCB8947290.1 PAS domain-containing sensor histidine kinase [Ardenticatenaceae bacterium]
MYKLRRYFFLSSLLAFITIAVLLAVFVRRMVRTNLEELAESRNVVLTQAFSNSLWPAFESLVADSASLSPEDLQNDPRIDELYALVDEQLNDLSIVKIKVYNLEGITVFSTELAQIGENKLDNEGYLIARAGGVASELTHRDTFSAFEQTISDRDVFSSYVPIYANGSSGPVVGVFEVYDDVTSLVLRTNQVQWTLLGAVVLLLGVLFTFLALIGQRTFHLIQTQYEAIRQSEASLKVSEEKYSNLFRQSGDGIFLLNWNGRIQDCNPRIAHMLGYSRDELLNMSLADLHPQDFQEQMQIRTEQLLKNGIAQFEIDFLTQDGSLMPGEVSVTMFELAGERMLQSIVRDIRERRRQEELLRQARDDALEASKLKSQLLANVSHDLRTPLNAILGYSEMLQAGIYGEMSAKQQKVASQIIDSTGHLLNFVNNFLDQAQIEAGKLQLNPQPFALLDLIVEVEDLVRVLAEAKGLTLHSSIAPEMPTQMYGDRYWLRQICQNLLSNSIKFTDSGSIEIKVFPDGPEMWTIQVTDTGIGIPTAVQEQIFEPFYQPPNSKQKLGFGLGLSIVQQLTDLMGGKVSLHSVENEGTTILITLPLQPVPEYVG